MMRERTRFTLDQYATACVHIGNEAMRDTPSAVSTSKQPPSLCRTILWARELRFSPKAFRWAAPRIVDAPCFGFSSSACASFVVFRFVEHGPASSGRS